MCLFILDQTERSPCSTFITLLLNSLAIPIFLGIIRTWNPVVIEISTRFSFSLFLDIIKSTGLNDELSLLTLPTRYCKVLQVSVCHEVMFIFLCVSSFIMFIVRKV